jgi:GNAT superfamily N-acetyltransferase
MPEIPKQIQYDALAKDRNSSLPNQQLIEIATLMYEYSDYAESIEDNLATLQHLIEKGDRVCVVAMDESSAKIVGYGLVSLQDTTGHTAILSEAYVHPSYRNIGIYTQLIKERELAALKRGFNRFVSFIAPDNTFTKLALLKNGYHHEYDEIDEHTMVKDLKTDSTERK